ncbi:MAG: low molecular weight protein-tyrosine-phosphatase [Spongiibacteraceae bacterium]
MSIGVLFVCLGNICRSPTAHGVFLQHVQRRGLQDHIRVDSAGTGDWHIGHAPDKRTAATALRRGYDLSELRARQVLRDDFARFQYILAMDAENLRNLQHLRPASFNGELKLFLEYGDHPEYTEVPDPYYGDEADFERVVDLVETAAQGLLHHIVTRHRLS